MILGKERKPFKREYIPIILAILILFLLVGALIYLLGHDFLFEEEVVDPNQHEQEEILIDNSNSKCSKEELNELYKIAENIKVETKKVDKVMGTAIDPMTFEESDIIGKVTQIILSNTDDKLYAHISNDHDDTNDDYHVENNTITFTGDNSGEVITYTIDVRANDYDCKGETIRKFTVVTPIYNSFSEQEECKNYPEFKYCQEYITEDFPMAETFWKELEKYKEKANKSTNTSIKKDANNTSTVNNSDKKENETNKDNKNILYIIIGGVVIIIGVVATVTTILVKKRRSRNI